MKQTRLMKILAVSAGCAVALGVALAQEKTTTTTTTTDPVTGDTTTTQQTTTTAGTITTYTPGSDYITFRTETSAQPVKYYYTKKTILVDPEGRTVEWSALKPDMPATVYYIREGDRVIARKIVLAKPVVIEKKTTTTTTTTEKP
jgi:hypothetical protein